MHINNTHRTFDLCVGDRAPLQALLDEIPKGAARRKTKGIASKVVSIEDIPKVRTPAPRKRTTKKSTPDR